MAEGLIRVLKGPLFQKRKQELIEEVTFQEPGRELESYDLRPHFQCVDPTFQHEPAFPVPRTVTGSGVGGTQEHLRGMPLVSHAAGLAAPFPSLPLWR